MMPHAVARIPPLYVPMQQQDVLSRQQSGVLGLERSSADSRHQGSILSLGTHAPPQATQQQTVGLTRSVRIDAPSPAQTTLPPVNQHVGGPQLRMSLQRNRGHVDEYPSQLTGTPRLIVPATECRNRSLHQVKTSLVMKARTAPVTTTPPQHQAHDLYLECVQPWWHQHQRISTDHVQR